mgnify:CR=1 FL=1
MIRELEANSLNIVSFSIVELLKKMKMEDFHVLSLTKLGSAHPIE